MAESRPKSSRKLGLLLLDLLMAFLMAAILVRPLYKAKYLQLWSSIESTFIADGRFLAAHEPHPLWQPLWYCGTRFDYIYPPLLRYGTALLTSIYIPVKAYHVFTAILFCLGIAGIVFMVRMMGGSRPQALFSAFACMLVTPSFLVLSDMRHDSPYLMPWRLGVMVRYGEGPHISSLSLLPFALGFAFLGLRTRRYGALALASVFSALVVLTNFYGATGLAIFYPVLVWSVWIVFREEGLVWRALAIPALAYALTAFWITPSYLKITIYNLRYVSQPGNQYSLVLTVVTAVIFGVVSYRLASRKPQAVFLLFASGCLVFMALNVLGHFLFNFRVIGEPGRLIPELDLAITLVAIEALRRLWHAPFRTPAGVRVAHGLVILIAVASAWPERHFVRRAWEQYPVETDYQKRVEYRISSWMATNMPDARTYVTGSTRFWWDAWFDNAQVGGGSDQGLMNPNPSIAAWENVSIKDPDLSIRWLQSLGADTVVVADKHSQDVYRDFDFPYKFAGILPVLFDDHEGNIIYKVPRKYPSLARVLDRAKLYTFQPIGKTTYKAQVIAYSDFVEQGPDVPTTTHWNGTDSISIHAPVQAGQSVLVQVTYDPSWHAYAGATELPIRPDGMDFMAIDAPPGTQDLVLTFQTPFGNRVGYVVSTLAILGCFCLGFVAWKTEPLPQPEPVETTPPPAPLPGKPLFHEIIGPVVRFVNRHLPEWPTESAASPSQSEALALVPPRQTTGRALELGGTMRLTPSLRETCGYAEVRSANSGPAEKGEFSRSVDHFNLAHDEFPYPDAYFDLVVADELTERDPAHMLLEIRRVLADGGYLLISTLNVASVTNVARTLEARSTPPPSCNPAFTFHELLKTIEIAGFAIERHFTTSAGQLPQHRQLLSFLALNGYDTENRGDQTWCLARKP